MNVDDAELSRSEHDEIRGLLLAGTQSISPVRPFGGAQLAGGPVEAATWDDEKKRWKVDVKVTGGKDAEFSPSYSIESDFLVSAVGQLNQPRYPDIPGLGDFKGKVVHSARWDWSYDMQGKRIGVVGNGMSPPSIYPSIHIHQSHVTTNICMRPHSSNWSFPPFLPCPFK